MPTGKFFNWNYHILINMSDQDIKFITEHRAAKQLKSFGDLLVRRAAQAYRNSAALEEAAAAKRLAQDDDGDEED